MHRGIRKGFTLVELIFVIVIIGVLSAVAVPKFAGLKDNAEVSNMVKAISQVTGSGRDAYMNEVDLSGTAMADVKLSDLFDFKGSGWTSVTTGNGASTYLAGNTDKLEIVGENNGSVSITVTDNSGDLISKLTTKTGVTFVSTEAKNFDLTK